MSRVLRVGLAFTGLLIALAASSSATRPETQRTPQLENDHVKVWRSLILPNQPLPPHRHEHGRVIVALQGGTMKIAEDSGVSETQVWEPGKAYWLAANPPGTMHSDVNVGEKPIEVMVVEVKDDRSGAAAAEVEKTTAAFHEALRTNDAETLLSFVADDVLMMPPGDAPVRGKDAFRTWYAAFRSQYRVSSLTLGHREVLVGEGFAVENGTFEWGLSPVGGGAPVLELGSYMQVWKRLPDGRWRFEREIWNSSVPAPAAR